MSVEDRFFAMTRRDEETGCLIWTGQRDKYGYGRFKLRGKPMKAHRVATELAGKSLGDDEDGLHSCDNPSCVDHEHLFAGTDVENMADMVAKGRSACGERHPSKKMTEELVAQLRFDHATGAFNHSQLGARYGIGKGQARRIALRLGWRHI